MTLVLPFGVDQIANNSLYSVSGSNQNSTMPCVFDNDSFERDFESALMRDWTSDIGDYDVPAEDSPIKTPSDTSALKRKAEPEAEEPVSKKPRAESVVPQISSDVVSSSSPSSDDLCSSSSPSLSCSSFLSSSLSSTSTSSSSSSSSSSSEGQDDDASAEMDDEDYMPRRRPYQMWTSRQRWKDERKKVMKMSVTKLSEIDDPELCLLRSVLINNTIKKLHSDIRSERQAKLRQRQQRMDFFVERFSAVSSSADHSEQFAATDFSSSSRETASNEVAKPSSPSNTSDFYDDSSCDEIFGINEEFLRVPVPDRRVSSPIPTTNNNRDSRTESMDTTPVVTTTNVTCYSNSSNSCDTTNDCSSPFYHRRTTQNNNNHISSNNNLSAFPSATPSSPCLKQILASVSSAATTGGSQCATQYRTNREVGGGSGGESFPPRVPILDEVVYHSLLASLETS